MPQESNMICISPSIMATVNDNTAATRSTSLPPPSRLPPQRDGRRGGGSGGLSGYMVGVAEPLSCLVADWLSGRLFGRLND
ncbi:hypothetical protein E2C01_081158 [Portunus trituberculatus]|uniref:Uncharacterized protein n=1 Tax=Portunus trituberculatus TaxID=210409 RepID=A0A5B7IV24_PORTR|nr:hypothetical protein [Portunus trituberculatus]